MRISRVHLRLLAVLLVLGLVAAACGSSGGDGGDASPSGGDDGTDEAATDDDGGDDAAPPPNTDLVETLPPDDEEDGGDGPVKGGVYRIGIEAEVNGVNPTTSALSAPGLWMGITVFDTLTAYLPDGSVVPHLAESVEPNEDFTIWTVTLREGISFHDGTPLNADAVVANFTSQHGAPLVGLAVRPFFPPEVADAIAKVDDLTVEFFPLDPDANFPATLAGQLGMVASPAWLEAAAADPALDQEPVGTGPFVFESRVLDSVTRFVRNDDWWGIGLIQDDIWLDAVEFYPLTDTEQRVEQLFANELDAMHTTVSSSVIELQDAAALDEITLVSDDRTEESFAMINTLHPPFDDIRARQALTFATPRDLYNELIAENVNRPADQMFTPDSPYYNPDVVQEADDPDRAAPLVEEYCAEKGTEINPVLEGPVCTDGKINIELQYSGPSLVQTRIAELLRDEGWSQFFNVTFDELLQDDHIQQVATGLYNVNTWRQFGAPDPSRDKVWLMCRTAEAIALNWPRVCDPGRDELILQADTGVSDEEFVQIQQDIVQNMNEAYTYIFFNHTIWAFGYGTNVNGQCGMQSVEGEPLRCVENGRQLINQIWLSE